MGHEVSIIEDGRPLSPGRLLPEQEEPDFESSYGPLVIHGCFDPVVVLDAYVLDDLKTFLGHLTNLEWC